MANNGIDRYKCKLKKNGFTVGTYDNRLLIWIGKQLAVPSDEPAPGGQAAVSCHFGLVEAKGPEVIEFIRESGLLDHVFLKCTHRAEEKLIDLYTGESGVYTIRTNQPMEPIPVEDQVKLFESIATAVGVPPEQRQAMFHRINSNEEEEEKTTKNKVKSKQS